MRIPSIFGIGIVAFGLLLAGFFGFLYPLKEFRQMRIGQTTIQAEVVRKTDAQARGLGGRSSLDRNRGMLFVFDKSGDYAFWMKDLQFPLDMIWIDHNFKIVHIEDNVSPETYPMIFRSSKTAQYVLEVNAGFSKQHNLVPGTEVKF